MSTSTPPPQAGTANNGDEDPDQRQIEERPQFRLSSFAGKEDPAEVRAFLRKITTLQGQTGWNPTKMANMVAFHLKDKAARWYDNLRIDDPVTCNDWNLLRPLFEARFLPALTSADLATLNEESKMTSDMDVMEFYDFCRHIQHRIALTVSEANRTGIHKVAFDEFFNNQLLNRFLQGLRPELKEKVLSQNVKTIQDAMEKARAVEIALRKEKPKTQVIAEVTPAKEPNPEAEIEELMLRIEAIQARNGRSRGQTPFRRSNFRNFSNNNSNGRRWGGNNNNNNNRRNYYPRREDQTTDKGQTNSRQQSNADTTTRTCFFCKKPGHFIANCNQLRRLQDNSTPKSNLAAIEHQTNQEEVSALEIAQYPASLFGPTANPWNQTTPGYPFH